jgi:integrase
VAQTQKEAVLTRDLKKVLAELPADLSGWRDQTLLLVGFAGGLRRSELCALDVEDVAQSADGLVLTPIARRPTRKAPGLPSAFRMARRQRLVPCARIKAGSSRAVSRQGQCSAASTVSDGCRTSGCIRLRWRAF